MLDHHADPSDERFPLVFEAGIPNPMRIPPAPDELVTHVRQNHRGLDRVTVKLHGGRKRYSQVNALRIGAKYDELPRASIDQICRAIMAICQDLYEERDQSMRFMIQSHVYVKATGEPKRISCHIELGESGMYGESSVEGISPPESTDDMMLMHIRECHVHILNQSRIIQEIGKEAIANAGAVFQARSEALEVQAEAQQTVLDSRAKERAEQAREARIDRVVQTVEKIAPLMLMQAMNGGNLPQEAVQQLVPDMAKQLGAAAGGGVQNAMAAAGASASSSPPSTPAPTSAVPAWARQAAPQAAPQAASSPAPATAGEGMAPEGLPQTEAPHVHDGDGPDPTQEPHASLAYSLFQSIEADQWGKLIDTLTKAQLQDFRRCGSVETDEATMQVLVRFGSKLKAEQQAALLTILNPQQLQWVMRLRSVAEAWQAEQEGSEPSGEGE